MVMALLTLLLLGQDARPPQDLGTPPEPSRTPVSWEVEFRYIEPRRIEAGGQVYWYLVYTAVNTSSVTQRFFPTFQLVTEDLKVIDTDMGIPRGVFDAIAAQHKATHPHLLHPVEAIGDLPAGEDNGRESVAIWRATDVDVNAFSIFVAGLSGETRVIRNPAHDRGKPESMKVKGDDGRERDVIVNPRFFTLRKTLELQYALPGSADARRYSGLELRRARWVMR
jgi:hypothetical protein